MQLKDLPPGTLFKAPGGLFRRLYSHQWVYSLNRECGEHLPEDTEVTIIPEPDERPIIDVEEADYSDDTGETKPDGNENIRK